MPDEFQEHILKRWLLHAEVGRRDIVFNEVSRYQSQQWPVAFDLNSE